MQYEYAKETLQKYRVDMDKIIAEMTEDTIIESVKEALVTSDKLSINMQMFLEIDYVSH